MHSERIGIGTPLRAESTLAFWTRDFWNLSRVFCYKTNEYHERYVHWFLNAHRLGPSLREIFWYLHSMVLFSNHWGNQDEGKLSCSITPKRMSGLEKTEHCTFRIYDRCFVNILLGSRSVKKFGEIFTLRHKKAAFNRPLISTLCSETHRTNSG